MFTVRNVFVAASCLMAMLWPGQGDLTKEGFVPGSNQPGWGSKDFQGVFLPTQLDVYAGQNFGLTRPWDTSAIGPVMRVRGRLAGIQQDSAAHTAKDRAEPLLVKYEVVEAWVDTLHASDSIEVPVRTLLYWAYSGPGKYARFDEAHLVPSLSGNQRRYSHSGASLSKVVIETRDFFVTSRGRKGVYGTDGWTISKEKAVSRKTRTVGAYNDAVAIYDISQTSFESR